MRLINYKERTRKQRTYNQSLCWKSYDSRPMSTISLQPHRRSLTPRNCMTTIDIWYSSSLERTELWESVAIYEVGVPNIPKTCIIFMNTKNLNNLEKLKTYHQPWHVIPTSWRNLQNVDHTRRRKVLLLQYKTRLRCIDYCSTLI
jgi:hypothetical protein